MAYTSHHFQRQLTVVTYSLLCLVLATYLLREFASILQPLSIALFLGYLVLPVHRWLMRRGIRSSLASILMLLLVLLAVFVFVQLAYSSGLQLAAQLPDYEQKLDGMVQDLNRSLPFQVPALANKRIRELIAPSFTPSAVAGQLRTLLGTFVDSFTLLLIVTVYLIFLVAERATLPRRILRAYGEERSGQIMQVLDRINLAIGEYLIVKTFISLLNGTLCLLVMAFFGLDFFLLWGVLIFVANYVPYIGSVVATICPIALALVQFESPWTAVFLAAVLIAVQQVVGNYLEPKLFGSRLGVSPLLILLSLAFWGVLWGVIGMIISVPLLVTFKIILDHIPATQPLATLMSNE